jgi:hypothetical protein
MEHAPYIPNGFEDGRQRILIVGHSHHKQEDEQDNENLTIDCVENAKAGLMQRFPFFARQPRYLNLDMRKYYERVALINFVPVALPNRYAVPPPDLLALGRERIIRVLFNLKPTHVFVLSSRLQFQRELPATLQEERGEVLGKLETSYGPIPIGSYQRVGGISLCCQLPHPQAAKTADMQEAFKLMLAI